MKIFVTGASGFIGSHLASKLIARGHAVVCLVRDPSRASQLAQQGAMLVPGDVTNRNSMREPMRGADAVFHLAGWYALGIRRGEINQMRAVNVDGTLNVLELAAELGVPKILHTSTVGVFGNTRGKVVDESYRASKDSLKSEYERTKWAAHYEVAVPMQQRGAPLIILQPGGVTGAGDSAQHVVLYRSFLRRTPVMFGERSGATWAHVDDIAEGHILAMERGRIGESYIIAGPALTYRQMMEQFAKITGIPAPKIWLNTWMTNATCAVLGILEALGLRVPELSEEGVSVFADYTFWASAEKAKRELDWRSRPVEETFRETLDWLRANERDIVSQRHARREPQ
jgi:nucleoside-diphosphate-sugar epimerase